MSRLLTVLICGRPLHDNHCLLPNDRAGVNSSVEEKQEEKKFKKNKKSACICLPAVIVYSSHRKRRRCENEILKKLEKT